MATVYAGVERLGAYMTAKAGEVDATAKKVKALAEAIAGSTRGTGGRFTRSFKIRRAGRGLDRVVVNVDPLAAPIEFGHVVRNDADGPVLGYVRGTHVMAKTYQRMPNA